MMTTRTHHVDGQYCWRALPWSLNQLNQQYDNPFYIGVGQPSIGVDAACQRGADIAAVAASSKGVEANSWTCQPFRRPLVASSAFSSSYSASHQWPTSATDLIAVGVDGITVGMTKQQQQQVAATAANRIDSLPASILAAVNDSNKRMQVNRDAMAMKRCGGGTLDFTGCPRTASEFGRCLQQQQSPTVIDSMSICQPSVADQMRMHSPVPQQRMSAASETSPSPRHSLCSDVEIGTVTSSPSSFTQSTNDGISDFTGTTSLDDQIHMLQQLVGSSDVDDEGFIRQLTLHKRLPPAGYMCHLCYEEGHYIQNCPQMPSDVALSGLKSHDDLMKALNQLGYGNINDVVADLNRLLDELRLDKRKPPPPDDYLCHVCFQKGHFIKDCPQATPREEGLTPYQGKKRCFGEFKCPKCKRKWKSGNSWANVGQDCVKCKINVFPSKQRPLNRGVGNISACGASSPSCDQCKLLQYYAGHME